MSALLHTVRMAHGMAGIGVWQYDPRTGDQHWSDGLRTLFGIDPQTQPCAGEARCPLFAHGVDMVACAARHAAERAPYTMEYTIHDANGSERAISVEACNLFAASGEVARIIAVVRDRTDLCA
jgi:PAS domain-containing protein